VRPDLPVGVAVVDRRPLVAQVDQVAARQEDVTDIALDPALGRDLAVEFARDREGTRRAFRPFRRTAVARRAGRRLEAAEAVQSLGISQPPASVRPSRPREADGRSMKVVFSGME